MEGTRGIDVSKGQFTHVEIRAGRDPAWTARLDQIWATGAQMGGWSLLPTVRPTMHDGGREGWLSDHVWVEAARTIYRVERGRRPTRKGMGGIASALWVEEACRMSSLMPVRLSSGGRLPR